MFGNYDRGMKKKECKVHFTEKSNLLEYAGKGTVDSLKAAGPRVGRDLGGHPDPSVREQGEPRPLRSTFKETVAQQLLVPKSTISTKPGEIPNSEKGSPEEEKLLTCVRN